MMIKVIGKEPNIVLQVVGIACTCSPPNNQWYDVFYDKSKKTEDNEKLEK